jgi:hypothetical protein
MNKHFNYLVPAFLLVTLALIVPVKAQFRPDRPTFFQDGYDQMQREIQNLQQQQQQQTPQQSLEHPSQLLTINNGDLSWQKYIFRDGGFSVWMPEAIQSNETVVLDTNLGQISFEVFATHPQSLRYVTAYSQPLDSKLLSNPQNLLEAVREGIIAKTQYKLKDDQILTQESYPARQLSMENQGEMITFRLSIINQRVYVLAASQKETNQIAQDVQNFFNSFRLLQ